MLCIQNRIDWTLRIDDEKDDCIEYPNYLQFFLGNINEKNKNNITSIIRIGKAFLPLLQIMYRI